MLKTPLGELKIYLDDKLTTFKIVPVPKNNRIYPDVNKAFNIEYNYISDGKCHSLKCVIENENIEGFGDSGENLEATSFMTANIKMTIGIESDFCDYSAIPNYNPNLYDYLGENLRNGINIRIKENTKSQCFIFGAAWIYNYTHENEYQTWYAADPTNTL